MKNIMQTEWWLDSLALPATLLWGRIQLLDDGTATALHYEFGLKCFLSKDEARNYLEADEFRPLEYLVEEGYVERFVSPPSAQSDTALLDKMIVERPSRK